MSFPQKLKREMKAVAVTTLFFALWLGVLVTLKKLILADYQIEFRGLSVALVGSLVIAKVVVVLEHVPLSSRIRSRPALFGIVLRTVLYSIGVAVVLLVEKAFEARHEYGGFDRALVNVFHHRDIKQVWVSIIWLTCAFLEYNALAVLCERIGGHELIQLFLSPPSEPSAGKPSGAHDVPAATKLDNERCSHSS